MGNGKNDEAISDVVQSLREFIKLRADIKGIDSDTRQQLANALETAVNACSHAYMAAGRGEFGPLSVRETLLLAYIVRFEDVLFKAETMSREKDVDDDSVATFIDDIVYQGIYELFVYNQCGS